MSGANPVDPIGSAAGDFSPGVVSPLGEFNIFGGVEGTDGNCFKISAVGLGVPPRFVGEARWRTGRFRLVGLPWLS